MYNHWGMPTQQRQQRTKWRHLLMNVVVDWNTNLLTFANGGHGSRGHIYLHSQINNIYNVLIPGDNL